MPEILEYSGMAAPRDMDFRLESPECPPVCMEMVCVTGLLKL